MVVHVLDQRILNRNSAAGLLVILVGRRKSLVDLPLVIYWNQVIAKLVIWGVQRQSEGQRKIFIGQLPPAADEEDVASAFAMFGPIENVSVLRNSSARCGFVTFASRHQALVAVDAMHGAVPFPESRPIVVRLASRRGDTAANASGAE